MVKKVNLLPSVKRSLKNSIGSRNILDQRTLPYYIFRDFFDFVLSEFCKYRNKRDEGILNDLMYPERRIEVR